MRFGSPVGVEALNSIRPQLDYDEPMLDLLRFLRRRIGKAVALHRARDETLRSRSHTRPTART
jgi:hypothetical protein